jgi:hypothetical protein
MEPPGNSHTLQLSVSIATDRDHFLRRTCDSCGLDFKTEADAADLQWALAAYCRRSGIDIGEPANAGVSPMRMRCPYCGYEDEVSHTLTEETMEYLKRIMYREYVFPQMEKLFSGLEDSFPGSRHSGGMFSVSVEFKHSRGIQPVRPIHGPDSSEFKIVTFLCCGKKIKIMEGWNDLEACSYCGTPVGLV